MTAAELLDQMLWAWVLDIELVPEPQMPRLEQKVLELHP